jgi:polysaccharide export outer membrane protein
MLEWKYGCRFVMALGVLVLAGCGSALQTITANTTAPAATTAALSVNDLYRLGPGDKLRIIVFGENELSGEFFVDDSGAIDLPLIGDVPATGVTVGEFEDRVVARFKEGYLRDPKVSIEVLNYRPFFIIGEVRNGGEYPYKSGLTIQDAVAMAGGFSYRANQKTVYIRRAGENDEQVYDATQRVPISPGDNIRIPERFF